ncbi:S1 RNA-binding domain-containing protein [Sorangium cellulosum]|uniref:S1 RNA-binding domain-containing protein n=1 Tax=Sorangium cellulosum TaxID=56 RepID=A0A4P2Q0P9_SORCE|nr:S1 RNA-binding domain-containing protein [Sorangium cellulosum]AUX22383.1 S1 RNA-binding domain-containing protein [Sorangium cellulosum]
MSPTRPAATSKESFASLFEQSEGAGNKRRRQYHTGETVEVTVVAIAREAVFADLGGKQEGMFERVALSDGEGKLRVAVGSRVSAVVSGVDAGTGQVRLTPVVVRAGDDGDASPLSISATGAGGAPLLVEGARVKGKVTGIERYGVFVQIAGTSGRSGRGLVPTAETATPRAADLKKHFTVGQEVEAKILSVDETGKIRLSIAALRADEERGQFESYAKGERSGGNDKKAAAPAPRNFGTLGDLLAKKVKR